MKQLLCLGDSITDAGRLFSSSSLGEGYVHILSEQLGREWEIKNRGVDGFTVQRVYEQLNREFCRYHPNLVTLLIGINDVGLMENTNRTLRQKEELIDKFEDVYRKLLILLQRYHNTRILLLEPFLFPYPAEYKTWYPSVTALSQKIQALANEFQLEYIPLWNSLLNLAKTEGINRITLDGIHLTAFGHNFLAEQILAKLHEK